MSWAGIRTHDRWIPNLRLTCCRRDVCSTSSHREHRKKVGHLRCATTCRTSPYPSATRPRSRPAAAGAAAVTSSAAGDADDCDDCDGHLTNQNRPS